MSCLRSSRCSRMGAPVTSDSSTAASTWPRCACVYTIPTRRRSPTASAMRSGSWEASITEDLFVVADDPHVVLQLHRDAVRPGQVADLQQAFDVGGHRDVTAGSRPPWRAMRVIGSRNCGLMERPLPGEALYASGPRRARRGKSGTPWRDPSTATADAEPFDRQDQRRAGCHTGRGPAVLREVQPPAGHGHRGACGYPSG